MTITEPAPAGSLTLYRLNDDLVQLLACRAEMTENSEDVSVIDAEIAAYVSALPTKVDAVAAVLRTLESQVQLAADEVARLSARRRRLAAARERLVSYVSDILAQLPEPKRGSRKLEGDTATLALVRNGGVAPLDISDESLVPDEYCEAVVRIPWVKWLEISQTADCPPTNVERAVANKLVRAALDSPCWLCGGKDAECSECGGTGKTGVPGARLLERGCRLEVR